ncbi:MAG: 1,2-phenylacetyl-CoA epoxidase subunit PaaC [Phycisphaerae bacterium]
MAAVAVAGNTAAPVAAPLRAAAVDLLYRLADDSLVIGHRNSEWTGLGPILEADIALSSMAQDEIGHAFAYYRLLHELGEAEPDALAFLRPAGQFRCASLVCLPRGDWAFTVVRQLFFDAALAARLDSLAASAYAPLAALARKIRGEQKYHLLHDRTWMARMAGGTDESRRRSQAAVDELYAHALGLFEPTPADGAIAELGVAAREADVAAAWHGLVDPLLQSVKLTIPAGARPVLGGRTGVHPPALGELVEAMQRVYRIDPAAKW